MISLFVSHSMMSSCCVSLKVIFLRCQSKKVFNMVRMLTLNQVALSQSREQGSALIVSLKDVYDIRTSCEREKSRNMRNKWLMKKLKFLTLAVEDKKCFYGLATVTKICCWQHRRRENWLDSVQIRWKQKLPFAG